MIEFPFQKDELAGLDRDKLQKLATYYKIIFPKGLSLSEMVDFIWNNLSPKPELPGDMYNELVAAGYDVRVVNGSVIIKNGAEIIDLSQMSSRLKRVTVDRLLRKEG